MFIEAPCLEVTTLGERGSPPGGLGEQFSLQGLSCPFSPYIRLVELEFAFMSHWATAGDQGANQAWPQTPVPPFAIEMALSCFPVLPSTSSPENRGYDPGFLREIQPV